MVANSKASQIIEQAIIRLKSLDLVEANDMFSEDNIPATIREDCFRVHWLDGSLSFERGSLNRKFTVSRQLQILILRRSMRTGAGGGQKSAVFKGYDVEENLLINLMKTRLGTNLVEKEEFQSCSTLPTLVNGDNWILTTVIFDMEYKLSF